MARQSITNIWANAATADKLVTPDASKQNSGWLAEKPSFRIFNWFWQKVTNMLQNAEKYGIMEWSAETNYPLYGLCLDPSTGIVYKSKAGSNLNHAVTDVNWWKKLELEERGYIHIRNEQPSGTGGGNLAAGAWRTRTLNTVKTNTIAGSSLASNQITLPAGKYRISAVSPFFDADYADPANICKSRIRNLTANTTVVVGRSAVTDATIGESDPGSVECFAIGVFTLAATSAIEVQTYSSQLATAGVQATTGEVEVYDEVEIWKVEE